ncbi:MAG: GNAT family N-acetyltransferase [Erysipelotrichales bacterium]|nr:GNAT family N-acetyltransferase [Erysipelotrichales bacterium]
MVANYNEVLYDNETIETERLILRKFLKSDIADIYEYATDTETLKFLDWQGVKTVDEIIFNITDFYWSRPGIFAIELKAEKKCIGCIDLRIIPEHEKSGFGYVLNRQYWNKGYMSEALATLLKLCFEKLELNRVESCFYVGNEGSGAVMKKCGMEFEGIGKQELKIKGVFQDVVRYGITREKWAASQSKDFGEKK